MHERNGNTLLRFLFEITKNATHNKIYLLGDILDAWVSDGAAFTEQYKLFVEAILNFKNAGGQVYYFEGNHDVHIDKFWTQKYGIEVFDHKKIIKVGDLTVRLEHGDYINPDDTTYIKYLSILRSPLVEFIGHTLPSHVWKWAASKYSLNSRKRSYRYTEENKQKIKSMIQTYAQKCYSEAPFDLIITGHMHVYDDYEFKVENKTVRSINLGTWLDKPRVLKIENNQVEMLIL